MKSSLDGFTVKINFIDEIREYRFKYNSDLGLNVLDCKKKKIDLDKYIDEFQEIMKIGPD